MIENLLQKTTNVWMHWVFAGLLESAVMLLFVLLIWGVIRKRCSQGVGYVLFLLVMIKLLVPIGVPLPFHVGARDEGLGARDGGVEVRNEGMSFAHFPERPVMPVPFMPESYTSEPTVAIMPEPVSIQEKTESSSVVLPGGDHGVTALPVATDNTSPLTSHLSPLVPSPSSLMLTWLAIVLLLLTRFAVMQWRFARSLRNRRLLDDVRFYPQSAYSPKHGQNQVPVYACPNIAIPMVYGLFRPMILFPEAMLTRFSDAQLRWVLLHELAHIRRRDLQTAFVQRLAVILHFYNPVVWVASYFMNHLRESACDDMALAADTTIPRKTIGDALLRIVEHSAVTDADLPMHGSLGAWDFAGSVRHRLVRLLDQKRMLHTKTGVVSMTLMILTTILLVPHWQAMPTPTAPQVTENTAEEMTNDVNTSQEVDEQKKNDIRREILELRLRAGREEVAATIEARKTGHTDSAQVRGSQIRHLQTLYQLLVDIEEEDFRTMQEYHKRGIVTEPELAEVERRVLHAKITLSKFCIDNFNDLIDTFHDIDTVTQFRENLLGYYQRLLELARQDYEYAKQFAARGRTVSETELRALRQKVIEAEIVVVNFQQSEETLDMEKVMQEEAQEYRTMLENRLRASREEVAATAEAYKNGRTTAEQYRDAKVRLLEIEIQLLKTFPDSLIPDYRESPVPQTLTQIAGSVPGVDMPVPGSSKYTPAGQERLKTLYQQIIEQEKVKLHWIEAFHEIGDHRGNEQAYIEAKCGVTRAKIDLSTFLLNETNMMPDEYARERQNLHSLYVELRDLAKEEVAVVRAYHDSGHASSSALAQMERNLAEAEIALIRLFPENDSHNEPGN